MLSEHLVSNRNFLLPFRIVFSEEKKWKAKMIGFFFLNSLRMSRGLFRWLTRFLFPELIRVTRVTIRSSEIPSSSLNRSSEFSRLKRCHFIKVFIAKSMETFHRKVFIQNFFNLIFSKSSEIKALDSSGWIRWVWLKIFEPWKLSVGLFGHKVPNQKQFRRCSNSEVRHGFVARPNRHWAERLTDSKRWRNPGLSLRG